jgi:CRP-like cAMP-binding protein
MLAGAPELRALVDFFHSGTKLAYSKGDFIIRPGAHPPGIFYIERGLVKAYDITKYGEENTLIIRKSGEFLGLTWGVTGQDKRIIYAAIAPTTRLGSPPQNVYRFSPRKSGNRPAPHRHLN